MYKLVTQAAAWLHFDANQHAVICFVLANPNIYDNKRFLQVKWMSSL